MKFADREGNLQPDFFQILSGNAGNRGICDRERERRAIVFKTEIEIAPATLVQNV